MLGTLLSLEDILFTSTTLVSWETRIFFIWKHVFGRQGQVKRDFISAQLMSK